MPASNAGRRWGWTLARGGLFGIQAAGASDGPHLADPYRPVPDEPACYVEGADPSPGAAVQAGVRGSTDD
jgi:hypothetical protein